MELLVAARRASSLFGEVHSVCQKVKSPDPRVNSRILATSTLPADVVTLGNAYQKLLPETLELVQNLSDTASSCVFPSECIEDVNSPDDGTLYDFSFSKSHDFGKFRFLTNSSESSFPNCFPCIFVKGMSQLLLFSGKPVHLLLVLEFLAFLQTFPDVLSLSDLAYL